MLGVKNEILGVLLLVSFQWVSAQDNSPYSRYGLGDLVSHTNVVNRSMGGLSAAYSDYLSINFTNPASYAGFLAFLEERSKKVRSGRVILDVGINMDNRTLRTTDPPASFKASNFLFSYMQLGIPIRKNWGLNIGLRPISRISYNINRFEMLKDPGTNEPIDSAVTEFKGDGGTYLASTGMGFAIKNLSLGFNFGYLFGKKQYTSKRFFLNDTISYASSNYESLTSFGSIYYSLGAQYKLVLNRDSKKNDKDVLVLGISGNTKQDLNARQDITRETFTRTSSGDLRVDSVFVQNDIEGVVTYPSSYTAGMLFRHYQTDNTNQVTGGGWSIGIDYARTNWDEYRFYGGKDSVKSHTTIHIGGELRPTPGRSYWNNVAYRAGVYFGDDYINFTGDKLPRMGFSFGLGLPIANYNRLSQTQFSVLNLAFEYNSRGNTNSALRDNIFRVSVGFSLSDLWFTKRAYE